MKNSCTRTVVPDQSQHQRRGSITVLAAFVLILVFGFTAFTVDIGYVAMTKGQLQNAADAGALAGLLELGDGLGLGAALTADEAAEAAAQAAVATVGANRAANLNTVFADAARDVRVGNYSYDADTGAWVKQWGVSPYNMIEVTLHRDQPGSANGDGPLDLFFAPVLGSNQATLSVTSTAVLPPGAGISLGNDGWASVLPITLDLDTWQNLVNNGVGSDNYTYDESTGEVTAGPDGILEVNLYPESYGPNPSNRGTIDIGQTNNSTADISRQILDGLNQDDLDAIGGELTWPRFFNGDPGLSAGIKDELEAIKGLPRTIPIFEYTNNGNGGNLDYYIVEFVGIRILDVKLTGKPQSKHVTIQPATYISDDIVPGEASVTEQTSIFSSGMLIRD
jgi:Flp pilus assembly protein TadG